LNALQTGSSYPAVRDNDVFSQVIPLPTILEQHQIVEEIEKSFSEADNLEKTIDESLAKAETLRQAILKQAFEGRLV
jgi:type I restriction enzyme S subunit